MNDQNQGSGHEGHNHGHSHEGHAHDGPVQGTSEGREPIPAEKPSQAEGDAATIDQDLSDKGSQSAH